MPIATALTLRTVFRLGLRQTDGLICSVIGFLGLDLAIPDHSTLNHRAENLEVARSPCSMVPVHLLVDSTGLKLCGAGEWLIEKHNTARRRSWRKLHIGMDADTGQIIASALTTSDVDDASQVSASLERFEMKLGDNLYKLCNRMSSGSYFPPAVKAVPIPKKSDRPTFSASASEEIERAVFLRTSVFAYPVTQRPAPNQRRRPCFRELYYSASFYGVTRVTEDLAGAAEWSCEFSRRADLTS